MLPSGVAAPSVKQFSFKLTTVSTSTVTASASSVESEWTRAYRGAVSPLPCPPRRPGKSKIDSLQEDDDIPLLQRSQERNRRHLSSTQPVEAVDECLSGSSVFDFLNMDCPALPSVGGSEMPPVSSPRLATPSLWLRRCRQSPPLSLILATRPCWSLTQHATLTQQPRGVRCRQSPPPQ